jgi:glycosyltransferase involved in cell wall biosynthesis
MLIPSFVNAMLSNRNIDAIIYSWNVPRGGLPKVMLKEYHYLTSKNLNTYFLTSDKIPESYAEEFSEIKSSVICNPDESAALTKKDISQYFPGLDMSLEDDIFTNFVRIFNFLKRNRPNILIVHQLFSAYLVLPSCLMLRIPYILILHDNPFLFMEVDINKGENIIKKFTKYVSYLIGNYVIHTAFTTVCTSDRIKLDVIKHLKIKKSLRIAEYGVDLFPQNNMEHRDLLLTVTKWSGFRNPEAYLEIARLLPENVEMVMCGRWDSVDELDKLKGLVVDSGMQNKITVTGEIPEAELSVLYDRTRVFLRLGFNESGTGQGIYEALGHGCAVVISRTLGASSIVKDGINGFLVDEKNPVSVVGGILRIFENDELFKQMSASNYELAKRYDWKNYLETIYQEVVKIKE